ncbi:cutinase transcription factor 1 beta [Dactylonectria macrodidyma]|uniref:Cutinase transcription factor 1 beta n=1 Tax=Dactylonectria macrodidyma TaxID=307937 RepID=A0A9P9INW8_9HYPO|nr:cutinase transcription factor 1 beta [Dactylonectria macrodidyma]
MTATVTKATDIYNLPAFIRPLPLSIDSEDVTYLQEKGALALPPPQLRNALLHAYVNYVHPYLPVLDIHNFLAIINADNHDFGHTSLLLFQAVMFSAAAFVEIEHLHNAGYADRKSARHALFQKTKLLYEFDYESDRLVVVQSLLLMTYWQKMPNDNKDMWHWLGIAISVAETIGLQREPVTAGGSPRQQRLRKRIWWCCAMRDHLLALGMRQPSRIQAKQREIQMLQVSDFEIELLPDEITILPAEGVCLRDIAVQQELAALCVAKVQLCVCIGNMIAVQYPPAVQNRDFGYNTTESAMKLSPRTELNAENIRHFDTQLLAWVDSLSPACQYRSLTPLDIMHGRDVVALHRTMLHMLFYTTMSALHRPQLLLPESSVPISQRPIRDFSQVRVRMAAQCVSRMANELQTLGLDKYLPATGVTVILFAMIINLQDMKNSVRSVRHTGRRCFYECLRVLEKLRNVYDNADWATAILDAALSTSGAYIDPQSGFIQQSAPSPNHFQKPRQDVSPGPRQDNPFASMVPWQDDFQWLTDSASSLPVSATENMNSSPASSTPDIETTFHLPESLSTGPLQDLEEIDWSVVLEDLTEADHGCKLFDELKPGPSEI